MYTTLGVEPVSDWDLKKENYKNIVRHEKGTIGNTCDGCCKGQYIVGDLYKVTKQEPTFLGPIKMRVSICSDCKSLSEKKYWEMVHGTTTKYLK